MIDAICPKCGRSIGEAAQMGAVKHVCPKKPDVVKAPRKPRAPKP